MNQIMDELNVSGYRTTLRDQGAVFVQAPLVEINGFKCSLGKVFSPEEVITLNRGDLRMTLDGIGYHELLADYLFKGSVLQLCIGGADLGMKLDCRIVGESTIVSSAGLHFYDEVERMWLLEDFAGYVERKIGFLKQFALANPIYSRLKERFGLKDRFENA